MNGGSLPTPANQTSLIILGIMSDSNKGGKIIQIVIMILGMVLFGHLIMRIGWPELVDRLYQIGWWFLPIFFIGLLMFMSIALAWQQILISQGHNISYWKLLRLKIIAEAINDAAPTANLGGEGARIMLLRKNIPGTDATSSVVLDKTTDNVAKLLFMFLGVVVSIIFIPLPADWIWGSIIFLILICLFNVILIALQWAGIVGISSSVISRISWLKKLIDRYQHKFDHFDAQLKKAYRDDAEFLAVSTFWHFVRRLLTVAEVWLILWLLTGNPNLLEPLYITAMTTVASNAYFIIPGQWGVAEGTLAILVGVIGQSAGIGISLGIIRRIRLLFFTAIGLLLFQWR